MKNSPVKIFVPVLISSLYVNEEVKTKIGTDRVVAHPPQPPLPEATGPRIGDSGATNQASSLEAC